MTDVTLTATVSDNSGNPVEGIALSAVINGVSQPETTDSSGQMAITVASGTLVTLTPDPTTTYSFNPAQYQSVIDADTDVSFSQIQFQLTGQVLTDPNENGGDPNVIGANIQLTGNFADGSTSQETTTNSVAGYCFSNLVNGSTYQYSVSMAGWTPLTGNITLNYPQTTNPYQYNIPLGKSNSDGSDDNTWQWAVAFTVATILNLISQGIGFASVVIAIRGLMKGAASQSAANAAAGAAPASDAFPGAPGGSLSSVSAESPESSDVLQLARAAASAGNNLSSESGASAAQAVAGGPNVDAANFVQVMNDLPESCRFGLLDEDLLSNSQYVENLKTVASTYEGEFLKAPTAEGFDSEAFLEAGADIGDLATEAATDGTGYAFMFQGEALSEAIEGSIPGFEMSATFADTFLISMDLILCA